MNRVFTIFLLLFLAGCATYDVKDAGDGVYYAESPPVYTYVDAWPMWYGGFYYPSYASCWYAPYVSRYCAWHRPHYHHRYAYLGTPWIGYHPWQYYKYPVPKPGNGDGGEQPIELPVPPVDPADPRVTDPRSLTYAKGRKYKNMDIAPAKAGRLSSSSAAKSAPSFGKRTLSAPKQRYSRPNSASRAPRVNYSGRATITKNPD